MKKPRLKKLLAIFTILFLIGAGAAFYLVKQRFVGDAPVSLWGKTDVTQPAVLAVWPWPEAQQETTHPGVTRWESRSSDGTVAILFDFDFQTNPRLRFEIYDQDEDDAEPYDNKVLFWQRGVGAVTRDLNDRKQGEIVAAWNGLFFGYHNEKTGNNATAFHVSPVVLDGEVRFNTANHRWGFGVDYGEDGPQWKVAHLPSRDWFQSLDWGGGSAQCLVLDGKPLQLQPFPQRGAPPLPQPVKSTPQEVGHIPGFDHMRTSRASLAWSQDNRHLFVLFVKEDDSEVASSLALKYRQELGGGWTVPDLQRFWLDFQEERGTLTAVNSDAGDVAQLAYLRPDGKYSLLPSRQSGTPSARMTFDSEFKNAPGGGAIMYFYVRDAGSGPKSNSGQ